LPIYPADADILAFPPVTPALVAACLDAGKMVTDAIFHAPGIGYEIAFTSATISAAVSYPSTVGSSGAFSGQGDMLFSTRSAAIGTRTSYVIGP